MINGHGPYRYRVTYENGEHHWEYLGPVDEGSGGDESVTNDDGQADNMREEVNDMKTFLENIDNTHVDGVDPDDVDITLEDDKIVVNPKTKDAAAGLLHEEMRRDALQDDGDQYIVRMEDASQLRYEYPDDLSSRSGERIAVKGVVGTEYGEKAEVDVDYNDKDAVSDLDWEDHHPNWDDMLNRWEVDADNLNDAIEQWREQGFDVALTPAVKDKIGEEPDF